MKSTHFGCWNIQKRTEGQNDLIKTTLTVRCVLGHEHEVDDRDHAIRKQGYTRCTDLECKRNAWVVKILTEDFRPELKAFGVKFQSDTADDMKHLYAQDTCPHCGEDLTGGNL